MTGVDTFVGVHSWARRVGMFKVCCCLHCRLLPTVPQRAVHSPTGTALADDMTHALPLPVAAGPGG